MITSAGVGVGGVSGAGMLRARRRDVSIKPNRKLDRKSSRGMIYENEELRLRTIHINAEVEQGQNDIKKLRRENEQLRREIWCLREEYDKLEEILKSQKSREDSENEDFSDDECTSGSNSEEEEEDETSEKEDDKNKLEKKVESIQDELLENAENQKLSSEKMNSAHRLHVDFDQLSTVTEEDEKKDRSNQRSEGELAKPEKIEPSEIEDKRSEVYSTGRAFNWIYGPKCPVLPSVSDQSVYCPTSPTVLGLINNDGTQVPREIGWQTIYDVKSSVNTATPQSTVTPSSSSENTGSTVVQKTSPDICVSNVVPNQLTVSHSSDNLSPTVRDNLAKSLSHSCQELKSNFLCQENTIKGSIAAKSLPDNSTDSPRAFKSQLQVQLSKPGDLSDLPPEMPKLSCTLCPATSDADRRHRRLLRQLQLHDYQATSFEHPNPQSLTLPVSLNPFTDSRRSDGKIYRDIGYLPVWPDAPLPPPPRVDTQTQTQSTSPTPSCSSEVDCRRDDGKSSKSSKSSKEGKKKKKKSERISTSSAERAEPRRVKNCRNSQVSKRRTSSRSQSAACAEVDVKNFRDTTTTVAAEVDKEFRKNSIGSEKLPWCACWGNGCV